MTKQARSIRCPESVLGLIPWYAEEDEAGNSLLNERQRGAVVAHAAECSDCRAELDMISGAPFEMDVDLPDPNRVFEEISARIESGEGESLDLQTSLDVLSADSNRTVLARSPAPSSSSSSPSPTQPFAGGSMDEGARDLSESDYEKLTEWILSESGNEEAILSEEAAPSEVRVIQGPWENRSLWAAAAAIVLLMLGGLGGAVFGPKVAPDLNSALASLGSGANSLKPSGNALEVEGADDVYVLSGSESETVVRGSAPMIDVVFADDASARQISEVLRKLGMEIVSGPSTMGVYRLTTSLPAQDARAASASDAAALAARLKSPEPAVVIFAEPVP